MRWNKKMTTGIEKFSKEARITPMQERPEINNSTLNALISVKWKELNEEEKQVGNSKAVEAMEAYKKELEEYKKCAASVVMEGDKEQK